MAYADAPVETTPFSGPGARGTYVTADYRPYDPAWRASHGYPPLAPGMTGFEETSPRLGLPDAPINRPIQIGTSDPAQTMSGWGPAAPIGGASGLPGGTGLLAPTLDQADYFAQHPDAGFGDWLNYTQGKTAEGQFQAPSSLPPGFLQSEYGPAYNSVLQSFNDPNYDKNSDPNGYAALLKNWADSYAAGKPYQTWQSEAAKSAQGTPIIGGGKYGLDAATVGQIAVGGFGGAAMGAGVGAEGGIGAGTGVGIGEGSASTAATGVAPAATQGFIGSDIAAGTAGVGGAAAPTATDFFGSTEGVPGYTTEPGAWDPAGNSVVPGTVATPGMSIPPGTQTALEKVFGKGIMAAIGNNPAVAAALAAGVLEKSNNPLTQPTIDAIKGAIASGQSIQGMQIPGITPSLQRAIDTANTNVGAWKPYTDEAASFTRSGGAPITAADTARYMNPYIEQALNPAARKVSEAAAAQRMSDAAKAGSRGAFGTERNDQIAGLNKRNELMSLGDVYGTGYANAFNTALNTAGADKSRALTAGGAFGNLATTTSALGGKDVEGLTSAGGIESLPFTEELTKQKTAGDVLSGAGNAGARAIGSTGKPSLLTNLTGAAGVLGAFDKLGGSTPSVPSLPSIPGIGSPAATPSLPAPSNNPFDDSNAGVFGS